MTDSSFPGIETDGGYARVPEDLGAQRGEHRREARAGRRRGAGRRRADCSPRGGEGGPTAEGLATARRAGDYHVVGDGENIDVPTIDLSSAEKTIIGNLVGSCSDLVELMALAAQGRVTLHTAEYRLDRFQDALDDLAAGRVRGRAILIPDPSTREDQPMIFITAKFRIRPEDADAWPSISKDFTEATRAEPGCLWFDWSRSLEDPNEYVLVEAFRDDEAGAAHINSDHFKAAQRELPPHLAETPRIVNFSIPQGDWSELGEMRVDRG